MSVYYILYKRYYVLVPTLFLAIKELFCQLLQSSHRLL